MNAHQLSQLIKECLHEILNEDESKCAWCGKTLQTGMNLGGHTSHGICPDCTSKWKKDIEDMKAKKYKPSGAPSSIEDFSK